MPAPSNRRFLIFCALWSLLGALLLGGAYAGNQDKSRKSKASAREPQTLARSSMLPVIADGQALRAKVIEARKILLKVDQETQRARTSLPAATAVFDPVHSALASKPLMPGQYGGGMSPRLEFIEKSLAKSLQGLAKLPSAAGQRSLLKSVALVSQAQAQIRRVAKEGDKLIQAVKGRLRQENDSVSAMGLDGYNKKLQSGLDAAAKALGTGLAGKNLDAKRIPKLGTAGVPAVKLPNAKEAGAQIASAGGGLAASKPVVSLALASSKASKASLAESNATPQAAGGNGSDSSAKTDTAKASKSSTDVPAMALACGQPSGGRVVCRCGFNVACNMAAEPAQCKSSNYAWDLESNTHVLADSKASLANMQAQCNSRPAGDDYCVQSLGWDLCVVNCYQQAVQADQKFMKQCEKPQIAVSILSADVTKDNISIQLSPNGTSGKLTLELIGPSLDQKLLNAAPRTGGTLKESFNIPKLSVGEVTQVKATWVTSQGSASGSLNYHIRVLGVYKHTQYNTPHEDACKGGGSTPVYLTDSRCAFHPSTFITRFKTQVDVNGFGISMGSGPVGTDALYKKCLTTRSHPADATGGESTNTFGVGAIAHGGCAYTAPLDNATVARYVNLKNPKEHHLYLSCGDRVYIYKIGVKTVTDACPKCAQAQLDNFTTASWCEKKDIRSLPDAMTIKLY